MRYEPALDGLRGVAIIAVVLFHSRLLPGGYLGVDLFFVLSGFLITSLLAAEHERSGTISLKQFYIRRWLRLGPPLLLMLAAFLVVAPFVWPGDNPLPGVAIAATYSADYLGPLLVNEPRHLGHMWSLAIEEQFYLLWPLLIAPLIRTRRAIPYLIVAYVVVTAWRCSFTDLRAMYDHFDSHCTGLILGCLLYFISYRPSRLAFYSGCGAVGVLLLSAPYGPLIPTSLAITAAELAAFVVISGAVVFAPPLLISAPMVRIGKLSYGIYLWHAPIAFALREQPSFLAFIASFGIATIAAAISYTTIEVWARRQRDLTSKNPDLAPRHVARRA